MYNLKFVVLVAFNVFIGYSKGFIILDFNNFEAFIITSFPMFFGYWLFVEGQKSRCFSQGGGT